MVLIDHYFVCYNYVIIIIIIMHLYSASIQLHAQCRLQCTELFFKKLRNGRGIMSISNLYKSLEH